MYAYTSSVVADTHTHTHMQPISTHFTLPVLYTLKYTHTYTHTHTHGYANNECTFPYSQTYSVVYQLRLASIAKNGKFPWERCQCLCTTICLLYRCQGMGSCWQMSWGKLKRLCFLQGAEGGFRDVKWRGHAMGVPTPLCVETRECGLYRASLPVKVGKEVRHTRQTGTNHFLSVCCGGVHGERERYVLNPQCDKSGSIMFSSFKINRHAFVSPSHLVRLMHAFISWF